MHTAAPRNFLMRKIIISTAVALGALLVGCAPPAVDPDAIFTIEGQLLRADGSAGAGDSIRVFKVDSWWDRERNILLDYDSLDEFANHSGVAAEYTATADASGEFRLSLQGRQVNRADGSAAAYLLVVYHPDADQDLATATTWFNFTDNNPEWAVGNMKLWDAGSGSVSGNTVTFSAGTGAPAGNTRNTSAPIFVLAYTDFGGAADYLNWGGHSYQTSITVPAVAFTGEAAPNFVMIASSHEGSRTFSHRTSYKAVSGTWAPPARDNYVGDGITELLHGDGSSFVNDRAANANLSTPWYEFGPSQTTFYIDLGDVEPITEVLIYNLVLDSSLSGATVTIDSSESSSIDAAEWYNLLTVGPGTYALQNWLYLGWSDNGADDEYARFIRVHVSSTGSPRYFESVAEVEVLY